MVKYIFKVILSDNSINYYTPNELTSYELNDLDFFSLKYKLYELEKIITDNLKTNLSVKEIYIVNEKKKEYEFSLISSNNPYIKDIFNNLKVKKIYRKNHYEDVILIVGNCDSFNEMKNFLFKKIEELGDIFFKYIYNRQNNLSELLHKYLIAYKNVSNNEDTDNLRQIKDDIIKELRIYKTYRGFALSRYRYENQAIIKPLVTNNKVEEKNKEKNTSIIGSTSTQYNKDEDNEIDYYEKEEFFEERELESMVGEGNDVKGLRRFY